MTSSSLGLRLSARAHAPRGRTADLTPQPPSTQRSGVCCRCCRSCAPWARRSVPSARGCSVECLWVPSSTMDFCPPMAQLIVHSAACSCCISFACEHGQPPTCTPSSLPARVSNVDEHSGYQGTLFVDQLTPTRPGVAVRVSESPLSLLPRRPRQPRRCRMRPRGRSQQGLHATSHDAMRAPTHGRGLWRNA